MRVVQTLGLVGVLLLLALVINVAVLPTNILVSPLYAVPVLVAAMRLRPRVVSVVGVLAILCYLSSAYVQERPLAARAFALLSLLTIGFLAVMLSEQRGQTVKRAHEAEEALRLRDRFLSIAAHELRTPLTVLKGNTQLLRQTAGADRHGRLADTISRQVGRMERLVEDMLDVSRIQAGGLRVESRPFDLRAAVEESIEEMALAVPGAELCLESGPEIWASRDSVRIQQVIGNLLRNAVQYSDGQARVRVQVWSEGDRAMVEVADRGVGIPRQELPAVFEPHVRGANVPADRVEDSASGSISAVASPRRTAASYWWTPKKGRAAPSVSICPSRCPLIQPKSPRTGEPISSSLHTPCLVARYRRLYWIVVPCLRLRPTVIMWGAPLKLPCALDLPHRSSLLFALWVGVV